MRTNIESVIPSDTTGLLLLPDLTFSCLLVVAAVLVLTAAFSSRKSRREACLKALKELRLLLASIRPPDKPPKTGR